MAMEIDQNHQANGVRSPTTGGQQQPASNVCSTEKPRARGHDDKHAANCNGESDGDSDSGSITCPLFMDGLPSNFATNPQLAAIASLMDGDDEDDVREDAKDDDVTQEEKDASSQNNKYESIHQGRPPYSTQRTTPSTTRHWKPSAKTQNRRRRQRASPYPRPHDRKNDKQGSKTNSNSVREITLFMNMWKP